MAQCTKAQISVQFQAINGCMPLLSRNIAPLRTSCHAIYQYRLFSIRPNELTSSQIADALGRFKILNDTFNAEPNFQQTLAVFYADILHFHGHAYRFVRRPCRFPNLTTILSYKKRFLSRCITPRLLYDGGKDSRHRQIILTLFP